MYNALIIDDEKHVRQTIEALGNWEKNKINPPYQASNGESALALMEETPINLVLVDIKMPVMDGIQFIELASRQFPKSKYIIVSGFNDFEYAKKAIQFQVMDYLLKPISEEELNQCLSRATKELYDEYELMNESPVLDLANQLCAQTPDGYLCAAAAVRIADSRTYTWDISVIQTLQTCLNHVLPTGMKYITVTEKPYLLLIGIMLSNTNQHIAPVQKTVRFLTQATTELYHLTRMNTLTGIGPFGLPSVSELKLSYQRSIHLVHRMNLYSPRPIIASDESMINGFLPISISSKKDVLKRAIEKGDITYFQNTVESYFESLKSKGQANMKNLNHSSLELLLMMQEFAQEKCAEHSLPIIPSLDEAEHREMLHCITGIINYFSGLFYELCQMACPDQHLTIKFILQEIKYFIEDQYACDITLTSFSDKYHLTKEYLSKQFKEQYGYGIYEYVLAFRMQKASEYLLSTSMKIQDISNQVGYPDTNYFSKAFKTFYGLSPKEYRQKNPIS